MTLVTSSPQLLKKYDVKGPRYTSYPTALEFNDSFGEQEFALAINKGQQQDLSLYVHVPFCHELCYYCGCNKIVTRHQHKADRYLDALEKEAEYRATQFKRHKVKHLHLGGGTPSFLTDAQMLRLIKIIEQLFLVDEQAVYSIEIDPRSVDLLNVSHLVSLGFSRISIGVQDFDKEVQQSINRVQDSGHIEAIIKHARQLGVTSVNLDLVYGLPHQSPQKFRQTTERVIKLRPDRISLFSYAHLPQRFAAQRKLPEEHLPDATKKLAIYSEAKTTLLEAGYVEIGMDHFALPEDELSIAKHQGTLSRNFQGYCISEGEDLLGLGVSSISQIEGAFSQNHKLLKDYYQAIAEQGHAVEKGLSLTQDDLIRAEAIRSIMCNFKLDFADLGSKYKLDGMSYFANELIKLSEMAKDGLLELDQRSLKITDTGKTLVRAIAMCFDRYREKQLGRQFSRII